MDIFDLKKEVQESNIIESETIEDSFFSDLEEPKKWYDNYTLDELLSATQKVFTSLIIYQKSVEVIGVVESMMETTPKVSKFVITNNIGDKLQVLVFNEGKEKTKNIVQGCLLHIDGGYVKEKKSDSLSQSTVNFDLVISSNCKLTVLAECVDFFQVKRNDPILTDIVDCLNHDDYIQIDVFILDQFNECIINGVTMNKGTLCKGIYKLESRMTTTVDMSELEIGSPVTVIGRIKYSKENMPYVAVDFKEDISLRKNDDKKDFWDLIDATESPKRKSTQEEKATAKKLKVK